MVRQLQTDFPFDSGENRLERVAIHRPRTLGPVESLLQIPLRAVLWLVAARYSSAKIVSRPIIWTYLGELKSEVLDELLEVSAVELAEGLDLHGGDVVDCAFHDIEVTHRRYVYEVLVAAIDTMQLGSVRHRIPAILSYATSYCNCLFCTQLGVEELRTGHELE